jgi:GWxTD domain-containing protein
MQVFERFFAVAPEMEVNIYMDLGLILSPVEQAEFSWLDEEGRRAYWRHYWRSRDPDQKTDVNERLLEHFIRIAYARLEFSKNGWPWDARGDLFVRYGEPDIRTGPGRPYAMDLIDDDWNFYEKKKNLYLELGLSPPPYMPDSFAGGDPGDAMGRVDGGGTAERWIYTDRGLDLTFDNPVMSGRYLRTDATSAVADAMEVHMPSLSVEEDRIVTFDPLQSAVTFRGENGKTRLEYSIGILPDDFGIFRSPTGAYSYIDLQMELYKSDWRPVTDAVDKVSNLPTTPQITIRGNPLFVHAAQLEVEPGEYILSTLLVDPEAGKQATADEPVVFPDYSGDHLMLSEIMPAARITEITPGRRGRFVKGTLEVLPLPGRTLGAGQPLFVYFEIYNLTKDAIGATDYTVKYAVAESSDDTALLTRLYQGIRSLVGWGERRAEISSEVTLSGIQKDVFTHLEVDMSRSKPGVYEMLVEVTDRLSGSTARSTVIFRTLPALR